MCELLKRVCVSVLNYGVMLYGMLLVRCCVCVLCLFICVVCVIYCAKLDGLLLLCEKTFVYVWGLCAVCVLVYCVCVLCL